MHTYIHTLPSMYSILIHRCAWTNVCSTYYNLSMLFYYCSSAESMLNQALLITESSFGAESEECLNVNIVKTINKLLSSMPVVYIN